MFKQINWKLFFILFGAGLLSGILVLPYAMRMFAEIFAEAPMPLPMLLAVTVLQTAVILAWPSWWA